MKKNRYEAPRMETVKIEIKMLQSASDNCRSLPKNDSDNTEEGIDDLDDLL